MKHKQPKAATLNRIASFPGVRCPLVSCHTLLTTSSCLEEHLRQAHPGYIGESGVQTNSGKYIIRFLNARLNHVSFQEAHVSVA